MAYMDNMDLNVCCPRKAVKLTHSLVYCLYTISTFLTSLILGTSKVILWDVFNDSNWFSFIQLLYWWPCVLFWPSTIQAKSVNDFTVCHSGLCVLGEAGLRGINGHIEQAITSKLHCWVPCYLQHFYKIKRYDLWLDFILLGSFREDLKCDMVESHSCDLNKSWWCIYIYIYIIYISRVCCQKSPICHR